MATCEYCNSWIAAGNECNRCKERNKKDWRYGSKKRYKKYRGLI